jgi:hypothetical protein
VSVCVCGREGIGSGVVVVGSLRRRRKARGLKEVGKVKRKMGSDKKREERRGPALIAVAEKVSPSITNITLHLPFLANK